MRARWAVALTTALTLVLGGAAGAASATEPVQLAEGYVLDDVDALSASQESQAQSRLEQLKTGTGIDLWVVYVDEFTDPTSAQQWADETAALNNLGTTQYLLAVATEGRGVLHLRRLLRPGVV